MSKFNVENKFSVGDRVKRTAPFYGIESDFMYEGGEYVITKITDNLYLKVEGSDAEYNGRMFKLVQEAPKFQAMKFRVENEEHSRKIQEHLFSLGYDWNNYGKTVRDMKIVGLYANNDGLIGYADSEEEYEYPDFYTSYVLKESTTYSLEKAAIKQPVTQQINIDGQALTEQDVRDLIAFKKLMQEQLEKFGGK